MFERNSTMVLITVLLITILAIPLPSDAEKEDVRVNWLVEDNPGSFFDIAFSTCEKGPHIYVAGFDSTENSVFRLRVEKRLKNDGSLVKNWTYMPSQYGGLLYDCVATKDRLYTVGAAYSLNDSNWIIIALDSDLNLLSLVNLTSIPGAQPFATKSFSTLPALA